jgi:hypothetical protein
MKHFDKACGKSSQVIGQARYLKFSLAACRSCKFFVTLM